MTNRDVIAIGTSAGGVDALMRLAKGLPADLPATILITIHLPAQPRSELDKILSRAGPLPVSFARDQEPLEKRHIYIAPPGCHLLLERNNLILGNGPRENSARPAIDPMLRSAAVCCGSRAIGVILTGSLGDGTSGLWALSLCGGLTVVQEPRDATFPQMPISAMNRLHPDHVVPLAQMPELLDRLVRTPATEPLPVPDHLRFEVDVARGRPSDMSAMDRIGRRSVVTCPDCGGTLWEVEEPGPSRFRCHIGHAYTAEALEIALDQGVQHALISARRAHAERVALLMQMAQSAAARGSKELAETWRDKAREYEKMADTIDDAMQRLQKLSTMAQEPMPDR